MKRKILPIAKRVAFFCVSPAEPVHCVLQGKGRDSESEFGKKAGHRFSIATDTFILERWNKDIKIFSGAARELGAEVIVSFPQGNEGNRYPRSIFSSTGRSTCWW